MPSKAKGYLKTHNRAASATTNLLSHGHKDGGPQSKFAGARTKSVEKIRRNASDVQHHVQVRNMVQYPARGENTTTSANVHANANANTDARGRRGIVLEVETNSGDDDEWVSSESGAVTPADNDEEDLPPTPTRSTTPSGGALNQPQPQQQLQNLSQHMGLLQLQTLVQTETLPEPQEFSDQRLPPPQLQSQPEIPPQQPSAISLQPIHPDTELTSTAMDSSSSPVPTPNVQETVEQPDILRAVTPRVEQPLAVPSVFPPRRARHQSLADLPRVDTVTQFTTVHETEVSSPEQLLSERHQTTRTRPPSTRSMHHTRPHPLIRTRSYAPATPTVAFSPTTVSPTMNISTSPESQIHYSEFLPRLRRQASQTSVSSVATLPIHSTVSNILAHTSRTNATATPTTRQRTQSHTSAALLSSLNAYANSSRPASPVLGTAFPPEPVAGPNRPLHSLIPPTLTSQHLTTVVQRSPMLAALIRVKKARAVEGV